MIIGIDVGGTFTDAVLLEKYSGRLLNTVKVRTLNNNILAGLEQALDAVLDGVEPNNIKGINLSTTIVTNLIAEKKYSPIGLILLPGPGLNPPTISFAHKTEVLTGAIDHRGRVTAPLRESEVVAAIEEFQEAGLLRVAVVGKFSPRNHSHELEVEKIIKTNYPHMEVDLGHRCGYQLNFPRRIVNTVLTAATKEPYQRFATAVKVAIGKRKLMAPIMILKADGGTLPLGESTSMPVETILSGPAASVLGALALTNSANTGVVVDIGGTTTDLALILSGRPLMSDKGVLICNNLTQVRSFAITALPVGGDSHVTIDNGVIVIQPERLGPAACLGGPVPTPTDALKVLGQVTIGSSELARQSLETLAKLKNACLPGTVNINSPEQIAEEIITAVSKMIKNGIDDMFKAWQAEPTYRVWELLQEIPEKPNNLIGVGGGAPGIVDIVAKSLGCKAFLPSNGSVANAIGAAVAMPTLRITLRADTDQGFYNIHEEGFHGKLPLRTSRENVNLEDLARDWINLRAERLGVQINVGSIKRDSSCFAEFQDNISGSGQIDLIYHEVFNIVRDHRTVGSIHNLILETQWEISHFLGGEKF